jgi:hypothetical protein
MLSETVQFGTGRQKLVLERGTKPKLSRRACTCEYGLQSCRGESAGVAKRPRERISHPKSLPNFFIAVPQERAFAGQIPNPSNPFGIVPLSNFVPRGFGLVHHSIAILYHQVPTLGITIRNFFIAVPQERAFAGDASELAGRRDVIPAPAVAHLELREEDRC